MKLNIQLFADKTGFVDLGRVTNGKNAYMIARIKWTQTRGTSVQNYSLVDFELQGKRDDQLSAPTEARYWKGQVKVNDNNNDLTPIYFTDAGKSTAIKNGNSNVESNWTKFKTVTGIKVIHNNDGTCKPTISGYLTGPTGTSFAGKTSSGGGAVEFVAIPRGGVLSDIPEFNIDTGFVFDATKPVTSSYRKLVVKCGSTVVNTIYEDKLINGNTLTLASDMNTVYNIMKNSNSYTFSFELYTYTDNTYTTQIGEISTKSALGRISNANPTMGIFDYEDINSKVVSLTGDKKKFILGYSVARYILNDSNKGITYKGATLTEYQFKKNSDWLSVKNISYPLYSESFVINNNELSVKVIDSRQNSGSYSISTNCINNYVKPSFSNYEVRRDSGTNGVKINGSLKYWNGNFGVGNNTLVYVQYRVKTKNGSYGNWISLKNKITISNGNVNINDLVIYVDEQSNNFALGTAYYVQTRLIDGIDESRTFNEVLGQEIYIDDGRVLDSYCKSETGYKYSINGVVNPDLEDGLQVEGKIYLNGKEFTGGNNCPFPVGFIYTSVDSNNPEIFFPGTKWEQFARGRTLIGVDTSNPLYNKAENMGGSANAVVVKHSHSVNITTSSNGAHTHKINCDQDAQYTKSGTRSWSVHKAETGAGGTVGITSSNGGHTHTVSGNTGENGVDGTNANLPPYIVVWMWKRTS